MADIVIHDSEPVGGKRKRGSKQLVETQIADPSKSNVVYVGRIPHGFYEKEMREFFEQFGTIDKLRISRNKQTGKSKHYGFIQFELPEVAAIVAESMNNYLLFESMLQVKLVPVEKLHPKMWVGANRTFKVLKFQEIQKKIHNRVRTPAEQKRQLQGLVKKEKQRRAKLKAAGIEFNFPDIRDLLPIKSKKVKSAEKDLLPVESKKVKRAEMDSLPVKSKKVKRAGQDSLPVESKEVKHVEKDSLPVKSKKVKHVEKDSLPVKSKKVKHVEKDSSPVKSKKVKRAEKDSSPVKSKKVKLAGKDSLPVKAKKVKKIAAGR